MISRPPSSARCSKKYPEIAPDAIEDVILDCAMPESRIRLEHGPYCCPPFARACPVTVPGITINRFCSSGLQAIALAANQIRAGNAHILIAGGSESMSMIPFAGNNPAPNPWLADHHPEVYMSMGLTAERVRTRYNVTREDADAFALRSHQNALKAQAEGKFDAEIVPVKVQSTVLNGTGKPEHYESVFDRDEGPRADTTLEALAKLKPVFHVEGTVTAGNSSQTSDGAAAAIVMSDTKARELGLKPHRARKFMGPGSQRTPGNHGNRLRSSDSESPRISQTQARSHRLDRIE